MRRWAYRLWLRARVAWCNARVAWCDLRLLLARRRVRACDRRIVAAELARDGRWAQRVHDAAAAMEPKAGPSCAPEAKPERTADLTTHRTAQRTPEADELLRTRAWLDQNLAAVVDMTENLADAEIHEHGLRAVERCNSYEPGDSPTQAVLAGFIALGAAQVLEARLMRAQDEAGDGERGSA